MPGLSAQARVEQVYRQESRRILATLIRLLGDFDLAEEALVARRDHALARARPDGWQAGVAGACQWCAAGAEHNAGTLTCR